MQTNTQRRAANLQAKIPDIDKTLQTVRFLRARGHGDEDGGEVQPLETTFELNDTLFARAEVGRTDEVYLWLGVGISFSFFMVV